MKQTLQRVELKLGASATNHFSGKLRQDYARCIGLFFYGGEDLNATTKLTIAGMEVFPQGTDMALFNFTQYVSRSECMYNLRAENIPARSSEYEFEVRNHSTSPKTVYCYFVLEND